MIKVLIADDHRVVRTGLEQLLENVPTITVVGSASDGTEAVVMAAELAPDVALMDLSMPNMDRIQATKEILRTLPGTRIVAFTSFSDSERILKAIDAVTVG